MSFLDKVKKFFNWSNSAKLEIDLNSKLYEQLKPFRYPLISVVLMMLIGSLGYIIIDNFSLSDAIYQAGMTFTTVGFTEVSKISPAGRLFTITFIFMGFLTFSFSIGVVIEILKRGDFLRIYKERSMLYKVARLKNHFVICFHNEYTIELTKQFRQNHIPFVVIDPRIDLDKIADEYKYPYFFVGDPHTESSLQKSHFSSAKGLITLSENFAENIAIVSSVRLYEKELQREPYFVMSAVKSDKQAIRIKKLGVDAVVSPTKLAAQRISAMSLRPDMENLLEEFLYRKDSPVDIEEVVVPPHSWIRFKRHKETHLRDIANVHIVGIRELNDKFIPMPSGDVIISTDARLLIIGTGDSMKIAKKIINNKHKPEELNYV